MAVLPKWLSYRTKHHNLIDSMIILIKLVFLLQFISLDVEESSMFSVVFSQQL